MTECWLPQDDLLNTLGSSETFGGNSTCPPPVLEPLSGKSIHFLLGICYSPPVSGYSTVSPESFFSGFKALCPGARTVLHLPQPVLPALASFHPHHLLCFIDTPMGKDFPLPSTIVPRLSRPPRGKSQAPSTKF